MILSFKQGTDIYFLRSTENAVVKSLPYTLLTLVAGWWGIPFGPIFSVMALFNNLKGGKDATKEVMSILNVQPAPATVETVGCLSVLGIVSSFETRGRRNRLPHLGVSIV